MTVSTRIDVATAGTPDLGFPTVFGRELLGELPNSGSAAAVDSRCAVSRVSTR